jgi:hypothetical protein
VANIHVTIPFTSVSGSPSLITSTVLGIGAAPVFLIIISIIRVAVGVVEPFVEFCPESGKEKIQMNINQMADKVFIIGYDLVLVLLNFIAITANVTANQI